MSVSFASAISAYNNAARITKVSNPSEDASMASAAVRNDSPFAALVEKSIGNTVGALNKAESNVMSSLTNKADITDVITAVSKAETTLKSVIAVRDRLISAYQEIEKMPI